MLDDDHREQLPIIWLWALVPSFLGVCIVAVLAEMEIIEFEFSIHDVDTFIVLLGLLITIILTSIIISRESLRRMQLSLERKAKEQYADDHARFLRHLDHEMKNPLMGIKTALDNMVETPQPEERHRIQLAMYAQIDRLSRLVTDLRKISELEHREIEDFPVDMTALLKDVFSFAAEDELSASRHVQSDIPTNLPPVRGDYDLLLLAVYNILNNALKYSNAGDTISLSAATNGRCITITLTDSGPGISPDDLPYVWNELYRSQRTKEIAGNGIGLSLVRRIIERHGGQVSIQSDFGHGTTVNLLLPILVSD